MPKLAWERLSCALGAVTSMERAVEVTVDYVKQPRATYCRPEIASIGLTQQQAEEFVVIDINIVKPGRVKQVIAVDKNGDAATMSSALGIPGGVLEALSVVLLELLPVNFEYWQFALILLMNGIGMGLFASPNRAGIMNSLPPDRRGVGAGMSATFQNSAMVLSIGIFFTLIILGLASSLPATLSHGLMAQGVPSADAARLAALPPVSIMFAALLGYNPIGTLLGPALAKLPAGHAAYLTGHTFFPSLISAPFQHGLDIAFDFAIAACLVAAVASLLRGRRYVHEEQQEAVVAAAEVESGDDLEGGQAGVLGVGDPAPVAGHLAQRG